MLEHSYRGQRMTTKRKQDRSIACGAENVLGAAVRGEAFEFRAQHRNVPSERLVEDLRRVGRALGRGTLTQAMYRAHGEFCPLTLASRFGGWNAALAAAGFAASRHFWVSGEAVLGDVRRVAGELKRERLLLSEYEKLGRYSMTLVYRHFGSWSGVLAAAGLGASRYRPRMSDRVLLENLESLWRKLKRQPKCMDLILPWSAIGLTPYQRRFGGFEKAMRAFVEWKKTGRLPGGKLKGKKRHGTSRSINWRMRYLVMRRDKFRCCACGRSPAREAGVVLQIDHIKPWTGGGETVMGNLQTLCVRCNVGKGDLV
jgi:hypothetical protein